MTTERYVLRATNERRTLTPSVSGCLSYIRPIRYRTNKTSNSNRNTAAQITRMYQSAMVQLSSNDSRRRKSLKDCKLLVSRMTGREGVIHRVAVGGGVMVDVTVRVSSDVYVAEAVRSSSSDGDPDGEIDLLPLLLLLETDCDDC